MNARSLRPSVKFVAGCLLLAVGLPLNEAGAQWTIAMRAMRNPLPVNECTYVEIVITDAAGRQGPPRPDGKQVSGWDFDFSVTSSAPDAFRLQNDDATRPFVCALAPTAPSATFTAHYPGRQLQPHQIVPGVVLRQSLEVAMAGGYPQADPATPPSGYQQSAGYPQPPAYAQPPAYPQPSGYPQGSGYSQPTGDPQPPDYPQAGPAQQAQPSGGVPAPATSDTGGVRTGKQLLGRIFGHAKRKAGEVAMNTTTHVADAAGDVVGTTLEAGSDVVKSGTGAVTGVASKGVQGVGKSLGAGSNPKDPADVAAALAAGRVVVYGLRFTEGTALLDPSSGPLVSQIAGALARTPGQFLIEAHVDGKNAAAAQAMSEQRAAAVKAALVAAGSSPMQLAAVGYGATRPLAGAKSSARIEIARTQ